jgi:single-strand DNA-binding protein
MSDPTITAVGNVATDIKHRLTRSGLSVANFRLACHRRRYDAASRRWTDDTPSFYTVVCWKGLAENVQHTLAKGDPVVVFGRLRLNQWHDERGLLRDVAEIDATSIGHDLNRGTTVFTKVVRKVETADEDHVLDSLRDELMSEHEDTVDVDPQTGEMLGASSSSVVQAAVG